MDYIKFKNIPSEVMEKYNKKNSQMFEGENRISLRTYVMQKPDGKLDDYRQSIMKIRLFLYGMEMEITNSIDADTYNMWKESGEVSFYKFKDQDLEDGYRNTIEKLVLLKYCVDPGEYWGSDNHFYAKLEEVDDIIEYFEDCIRTNRINGIMEELKDYIDNCEKDDQHKGMNNVNTTDDK